jgi:hypothetical protein
MKSVSPQKHCDVTVMKAQSSDEVGAAVGHQFDLAVSFVSSATWGMTCAGREEIEREGGREGGREGERDIHHTKKGHEPGARIGARRRKPSLSFCDPFYLHTLFFERGDDKQ